MNSCIRVALAGNPNCGKTSIFNALTGAHQHVANYAGVTVERRSGTSDRILDGAAEVIDLPGTYSLSAYSPEERVAEEELDSGPHVVVMVADSTQLKRHLVLLAQILQTGANPVLCLNMADEARAAGQRIDLEQMQRLLGFPVVETVGHKGEGIDTLVDAIHRAIAEPVARHRLVLGEDIDLALHEIRAALPSAVPARSADWVAVRLLAGDERQTRRLLAAEGGQRAIDLARNHRRRIEAATRADISVYITERYFGFVDGLLREVCRHEPRLDARQVTDRIDSVVVHPFLGLPLFAAVMFLVFWLTFTVGEPPMRWIEAGVLWTGHRLSSLWPAGSDSLLRSLLVDGVIGGVGGVIVFLPNILLLFLGLAFLEDTGYMARAAFLTDRLMHRFGLHGKSFIPMVTGFGCSVPGIMATRTLENERDRLTTMLVLPLMSCGARLPIWMLLIPAFFAPVWRAPVLWLIYGLGIGLALLLALTLRRTLLRGDDAPFVMELPPYRLPTPRSVVIKMLTRAKVYLRKAGMTILGISILLWAATSFPKPAVYRVDAQVDAGSVVVAAPGAACPTPSGRNITCVTTADRAARRAAEDLEYSVAGRLGHALAPAFAPLGFDWKIVTAMIGAFAAKEVFVAQMGIVYSLSDAGQGTEGLRALLARDYSPLAGISVMVFLLVSAPCMATIAVTRRESGNWRWALLQLGGLSAIAYVLGLVVYQLGRFVI